MNQKGKMQLSVLADTGSEMQRIPLLEPQSTTPAVCQLQMV